MNMNWPKKTAVSNAEGLIKEVESYIEKFVTSSTELDTKISENQKKIDDLQKDNDVLSSYKGKVTRLGNKLKDLLSDE